MVDIDRGSMEYAKRGDRFHASDTDADYYVSRHKAREVHGDDAARPQQAPAVIPAPKPAETSQEPNTSYDTSAITSMSDVQPPDAPVRRAYIRRTLPAQP